MEAKNEDWHLRDETKKEVVGKKNRHSLMPIKQREISQNPSKINSFFVLISRTLNWNFMVLTDN
ncbi:MAG TPA: hypothetical protein DDW50_15200 [Firmicutes bacterium]|jgi:hypothetical protein|nr:hypothetical protein [Bacillota bacterium]